MTSPALTTGSPRRRRALFGLLDADGWSWAGVKAFVWFILIIFVLAYLPDRAYYFTVNRTLDLGIQFFSPVNLCPPTNETLPCPAPQGSVLPWHPSPPELSLPNGPRTDGSVIQAGSKLLYIGGSDGTKASNEVYVAQTVATGNFDKWQPGPNLPQPRANAAVVSLGGQVFVIGGTGPDGKPTDTTFVLSPNADTGDLGQWQTSDAAQLPLTLPAARTGASVVALGDGLLLIGGSDGTAPTTTVWKSTLASGKLGKWGPVESLQVPVTDAFAAQIGDYVWVIGGTSTDGPIGGLQRARVGSTGTDAGKVFPWGIRQAGNLPEARTNVAGFSANGALYVVGGSDGTKSRSELYWATPVAGGGDLGDIITEWKHLPQSDLPAGGLEGSSPVVSGPNAILVGGKTSSGVIASAARANLAPEEPFFQLGLVGATVPALKIDGEIGQQLGYLNAAGVGTVDFVALLIVGWAFAHKAQVREMVERARARRRR